MPLMILVEIWEVMFWISWSNTKKIDLMLQKYAKIQKQDKGKAIEFQNLVTNGSF